MKHTKRWTYTLNNANKILLMSNIYEDNQIRANIIVFSQMTIDHSLTIYPPISTMWDPEDNHSTHVIWLEKYSRLKVWLEGYSYSPTCHSQSPDALLTQHAIPTELIYYSHLHNTPIPLTPTCYFPSVSNQDLVKGLHGKQFTSQQITCTRKHSYWYPTFTTTCI